MTPGGCRLLGVDVDGTLVRDGRVDPADAEALRAAGRNGLIVCLCTGRSLPEVRQIWQSLRLARPHAPLVCAGGALVAEPDTGRTLYSRAFNRPTAGELAEEMHRLGFPVMGLVDSWREGFDYYVLGEWEDHPLYRRFFRRRPGRVLRVDRIGHSRQRPVLRLSILAGADEADEVVRLLRRRFAGRVHAQAIHLPVTGVHIVEAFAPGADKFRALVYVGQGFRIAAAAMAAIGDDYNDLPMLRGVALSAVPADAPEPLRRAADMVLGPRGDGLVAEFVRRVLGDAPARGGE